MCFVINPPSPHLVEQPPKDVVNRSVGSDCGRVFGAHVGAFAARRRVLQLLQRLLRGWIASRLLLLPLLRATASYELCSACCRVGGGRSATADPGVHATATPRPSCR